jgi:membrane associated rhomboid family serine protease
VIPVGDSVRSRSAPVANWTLIIVNFLVFFVELAQGPHAEAFLSRWALIPAALTGAVSPPPGALPPVLTIFTAMFLHGGWGHILFYLLCGVIASLAQVAMMPDATVPNLGASGAISGVLGAYILMYPRARVTVVIPLFLLFPFLDVPAWLMLGLWFLTQFTNGLASLANTVQTGGVAFWAHIGGFVAGLVLVNFFRRRRYVPQWPISYQ